MFNNALKKKIIKTNSAKFMIVGFKKGISYFIDIVFIMHAGITCRFSLTLTLVTKQKTISRSRWFFEHLTELKFRNNSYFPPLT